jgi:hypothetical protein
MKGFEFGSSERTRENQREPERTRENQREPERTRENQREPEKTRENQREPEKTLIFFISYPIFISNHFYALSLDTYQFRPLCHLTIFQNYSLYIVFTIKYYCFKIELNIIPYIPYTHKSH